MASRNPLGSLFGRSPIGPIQDHMTAADKAAQLLPSFVQATIDDKWEKAEKIYKNILEAEREADQMKSTIRQSLPKSLFLPVPRSDLLELVTIQDQVANRAKDVAGIITGRHMQFPEKMQKGIMELLDTCAATSNQALASIGRLDELLEVGFSGREVNLVNTMLKELNKLEAKTDKQAIALRLKLFKLEAKLPAVDVMFYYEIIGLIGGVADAAESVGDRLQILIAR